jgi:hypothetical protein
MIGAFAAVAAWKSINNGIYGPPPPPSPPHAPDPPNWTDDSSSNSSDGFYDSRDFEPRFRDV